MSVSRRSRPRNTALELAVLRGLLAEWEVDETSQRTYKCHRYRAQQGKWRGGPIPYGLQPESTGWFEPDPETYPILLWMLEWRVGG